MTGEDGDLEYMFPGSDDDFSDEDGLQEEEDILDREQRNYTDEYEDNQPGFSGLGLSPCRSPTPTPVTSQFSQCKT